MAKKLGIASFFAVMCLFLWPQASSAAGPEDPYLGQVLIDIENDGEAWYVNPQSRMKVYLGRPDQALDRLTSRAIRINYGNIGRIAVSPEGETDAEYAAEMAGFVLFPNDLIGASWYVDPETRLRKRLATSSDAWAIMSQGRPVLADILAAIPTEPEDAPRFAEVTVQEILSGDTIEIDGGATVRILSVEVPENPELQEAAMSRMDEVMTGKTVIIERDVKDTDADGNLLRHIHFGAINMAHDLVSKGLAFHAIEFPNVRHAELLIVGAIDAMRQENGFWNKQ